MTHQRHERPAVVEERLKVITDAWRELGRKRVQLMEVCGTHTMSIARAGLRSLLPEGLELVSGPGCPVCVTPTGYVNAAMKLARRPDVITTTFGDMMRVPGTSGNLEAARAAGADVRMLYSPMKSLDIAAGSPDRTVVFLGVGFETTAPGSALLIRSAAEKKVSNLAVFSAHKLIPPALRVLCADPDISVTGFIMPGHVTVVLGPEVYEFIPREFGIPCVVTGFEPGDVLESIGMLLRQLLEKKPRVENQYKRVVKPGGNELARQIIDEVFEPADTHWRGFGMIPRTGLAIREKYAQFDAERRLDVRVSEEEPETGCRCGDVVRGKLYPKQCPLFARKCTPATPVGPCMVSSEGACAASYRYERT